MSTQITTAFVQQYKANVTMLYQQMASKLRGKFREEAVNGNVHYFERLGAVSAVKKTTRHADTPLLDSPHSRRMVSMSDYEWADLVDQYTDKIRLLISPESEYAKNGAMALNRAYDDEAILAFDGTAYSGVSGGTTVAFASDNPAGDEDFSGAALTTGNVAKIKQDLDGKDVPADGRSLIISPAGLYQLLKQTTAGTVVSSDYNTVKSLVRGEVDTWLGFNFITSTRLPIPASNKRYGYAWHKDSMGMAMGKDITTKISERPDKSFAVQVYLCGTYGATRIQGEGVVRFKIDETN